MIYYRVFTSVIADDLIKNLCFSYCFQLVSIQGQRQQICHYLMRPIRLIARSVQTIQLEYLIAAVI